MAEDKNVYGDDFTTIYVDLAKTKSAPSEALDGDGAVRCDTSTGYGVEGQQLTFEEFREYLVYRCEARDVTFLLKNQKDIIETTNIFRPYQGRFLTISTHSNITMKSQRIGDMGVGDETNSFKFNIAVLGGTPITWYVGNSNLTIHDMDFQSNTDGYIKFEAPDDGAENGYNRLDIRNSRFWVHAPSELDVNEGDKRVTSDNCAIFISQFCYVTCLGNVFSSKSGNTSEDTSIVVTQPTYSGYTDNSTGSNFQANIFVEFYKFIMLRQDSPFEYKLDWNVFSGGETGFRSSHSGDGSNYVQLVESHGDYKYNEFEWDQAPAVCAGDLTSAINGSFDYKNSSWDTIDYFYTDEGQIDDDDKSYLNDIDAYGRRDGVGALWFNPMTPTSPSVIPNIVSRGDSIALKNNDAGYDALFEPIGYRWVIDGDITDTTAHLGALGVTFDSIGVKYLDMIVYSHNRFYDVSSRGMVRVTIDAVDVLVELTTEDSFGVATSSFDVGDDVIIEVINRIDDDDDNILSTHIIVDDNQFSIYIPSNGDRSIVRYRFDTIGVYPIVCKVVTLDGMTHYFNTSVTVSEALGATYYVDLSEEYEDGKWLDMNYGVYDDFESGYISSYLNSSFISNYTVVRMHDELVATGTDKVGIITGIKHGDFNVEWSFVRDSEDDRPSVEVVADGYVVEVVWDFIDDAITVVVDGNTSTIKYRTFIKDLSCPGSLPRIHISVNYNADDGITVLGYNVDDGDDEKWVGTLIDAEFGEFSNMLVSTQCDTGSGLGYVGIKADDVDEKLFTGYGNGTELAPYTYTEMYNRIKDDRDSEGEMYDNYLCRNSRRVDGDGVQFTVDRDKRYHIDVWNPHLYGPWVLIFYRTSRDVSFDGVTLSNGVIYNIPSGYISNLLITTTYDMFITWNGPDNKIGFMRNTNQYTENDTRSDIIGSTIKSVGGVFTDTRGDA